MGARVNRGRAGKVCGKPDCGAWRGRMTRRSLVYRLTHRQAIRERSE